MKKHAVQRCKERGIRRETVSLICQLGTFKKRPGNVFSCTLTKSNLAEASTKNLSKREIQMIDKASGVVVIVDRKKEKTITAYHKKVKIKRNRTSTKKHSTLATAGK